MVEVSEEIWKRRAELLRKAKGGKLDFVEFAQMNLHKETKGLLGKHGGLSEKGLSTLCAIETYLSSIPYNTKDVAQEVL